MQIQSPNHILKVASANEVDVRNYQKETKTFVATGAKEKLYEYILVSDDPAFPEKFTISSKKDFTKLEGKKVVMALDITAGYQNKIRVSLADMREAPKG